MGDLSAEPSMEDILASIKRVIREGEPQHPPRRMSPRPSPDAVAAREEDEVLELSQAIPQATPPAPAPAPAPAPVHSAPADPEPVAQAAARPVAAAAPQASAAGLSPATAEAARGALGQLSRLMVKPEPSSDGTLEGLVRELLRPMVSEWLDANLPRLVEEMVAREIAKITDGAN